MTAPLTIELAGRRLPALRVTDRDPGWWTVTTDIPLVLGAIIPAGESGRAIAVSRYEGRQFSLLLGDVERLVQAFDGDGFVSKEFPVAWCATEAVALAQIVEWSTAAGSAEGPPR